MLEGHRVLRGVEQLLAGRDSNDEEVNEAHQVSMIRFQLLFGPLNLQTFAFLVASPPPTHYKAPSRPYSRLLLPGMCPEDPVPTSLGRAAGVLDL